ncbi:peptidoglycan-binding protein [Bartonella sp. W8125]|uniref:Acb2/Tad1 domain-containing protein n=1 Tax=Bartonella TaxID=773 RepID=UPI0018DD4E9A|nr:peptidoglycan-binding protein [Bartonella choladocola]MBI0141220.1 peptidoglycan-binding protein [Bartonella choladocola]
MLYKADILAICPNAKAHIVDAMVAGGYKGLWERFGITSPIAQAKFMGQIKVESAGLTRLLENLNYTAKRLCQVWPKRFKTLEDAQPYANNPQALANKVYGGRMGNTKEGDGWRYRGRGLKQLTGHDNYEAEGKALGVDLIGNPDEVAKPDMAFLTALSYFQRHIGKSAETASVETVTIAVNGGTNGLEEREIATERAFEILAPGRMKIRLLEHGSKGLDVALLQAQLVELGENINVDGVFGDATEKAVNRFKALYGLPNDGVYDSAMRNEVQIALQTERLKADPTIGQENKPGTEQSEQVQPLPDLPIDAVMTLAANIVTAQNGNVMGMNSISLSSDDFAKIAKIKRTATVLWGQIKDLGESRETAVALTNLETAIMWATKSVARQAEKHGA